MVMNSWTIKVLFFVRLFSDTPHFGKNEATKTDVDVRKNVRSSFCKWWSFHDRSCVLGKKCGFLWKTYVDLYTMFCTKGSAGFDTGTLWAAMRETSALRRKHAAIKHCGWKRRNLDGGSSMLPISCFQGSTIHVCDPNSDGSVREMIWNYLKLRILNVFSPEK